MSPTRGIFWALYFYIFLKENVMACYRKPQGSTGDPSPVDENYQILISGNPSTYHPGVQYNITLACDPKLKFISFTLVVEAEDPSIIANHEMLGTFYIIDKAETKFSDLCNNMIESNNNNIKETISVAWEAPSNPKCGCVLFKAAILQQRDVWFMDGGFLTKRLCPEEIDEVNTLTPPVNPCCACDEAKYEIIIERKWTRNSHPKDFPLEAWRTRFGVIVGASHSVDYRFWEYGTPASNGLRQLAEHGATRTLEEEIKYGSADVNGIRTIIKAPGIDFKSNVVTKTLANVRVSPTHHQISLVTKIEPSPDWILGVAALELCLSNCTWVDKKILYLYPWDVGTDAGPSYMSADQAQRPPDVIRRISSNFPNDVRSPFYDASGTPMNPMAKLIMTRKRTYERPCIDVDIGGYLECATHPWNEWTECSAKCGSGKHTRERSFKNPDVAKNFPNCTEVRLKQIRNCVGNQCGLPQGSSDSRSSIAECEVRPWAQWSPCSKKCGKGFQTRSREYANQYAKDKCQAASPIDLLQTRTCTGNICGGNIASSPYDFMDEGGAGMYNSNNFDANSNQNVFPGSSFNKPRTPSNRDGDFQRTQFNPYDSANQNPYDASDMGPQSRAPGYGQNDYNNMGNTYGNDQLRGNSRNAYEIDSNQPLFGDLEASNDDRDPFGNIAPKRPFQSQSPPLNKFGNINSGYQNQNQNQNQNFPLDNSASSYQTSNSPSSRYRGINPTDQLGAYGNMGNDNLQNNRQDQFDFMGNVANDPYQNQYDPKNAPLDNANSYNDPRLTTQRPYGSGNSFTTSRSNIFDSPSSAFDNTMDFGNANDQQSGLNAEDNYCLQKPIPYTGCDLKRVIVKNYWFYDADDGQCKLFTADNCDENRNKFFSLESCERACAAPGLDTSNDANFNQGFQTGGYDQPPSYGMQRPSWGV